ncbi:MAG: hypothetical protein V4473_01410 [Patescibacteria group bacterium]
MDNNALDVRYEVMSNGNPNPRNTKDGFWTRLGKFILALLQLFMRKLSAIFPRQGSNGFKTFGRALWFLPKWLVVKPIVGLFHLAQRNRLRAVIILFLVLAYTIFKMLVDGVTNLIRWGMTTSSNKLPSKIPISDNATTYIEIGVALLGPIAGAIFLWWAYRRRNPSTSENDDSDWFFVRWGKTLHEKGYSFIIGGILAIHWGLYELFEDKWLIWTDQHGFYVFQILMVAGIGFKMIDKKVTVIKGIGGILIWLGAIGLGWNVIQVIRTPKSERMAKNSQNVSLPTQKSWKPSPLTPPNANKEEREFAKKFLEEQEEFKGKPEDARRMLQHGDDESNANHFSTELGADGRKKVLIHYNLDENTKKVKSFDIGYMQINSTHLEALKKLGIDPYTFEGNLKAAMYVYRLQGHGAWATDPDYGKGTRTDSSLIARSHPPAEVERYEVTIPQTDALQTTAPVGKWSEDLGFPLGKPNFSLDCKGYIEFQINRDPDPAKTIKYHPDPEKKDKDDKKGVKVGKIRDFRFRADPDVNVEVPCHVTYTP